MSLWVRKNTAMRLPVEASQAPVIMVGPGTGVAPFRGHWQVVCLKASCTVSTCAQTRAAMAEHPVSMLFFGCRHRDKDWLYGDEMAELQARGIKLTAS